MFQSKGRDKTKALHWEYGLRGDRLSKILATPGGLEPPIPRLGIPCSILLMQLTQGWFHLCRASRYATEPVFYLAFETNAVEPPLILLGVRKPETGYSLYSDGWDLDALAERITFRSFAQVIYA